MYRPLERQDLIDPNRRGAGGTSECKRWERGRPMELWQMDVVGRVPAR